MAEYSKARAVKLKQIAREDAGIRRRKTRRSGRGGSAFGDNFNFNPNPDMNVVNPLAFGVRQSPVKKKSKKQKTIVIKV